jgi:(R,R)-butanediol dehydrogenase/meso-butanediol dehydrogenase/diacetyl reductase
MRAPVLRGRGSIRYEEVDEPEPGPGEVLLSVGLCGICGSDLHLYDSDMAPDGIVMGHEFGATVLATGAGVEGWEAGDRVVATMPEPCMNGTFCRRGEHDLCYQHFRIEMERAGVQRTTTLGSGGYGPLMKTTAPRLLRVPDGLNDRQAACVEPAAVGFHAVRNAGMKFGDRVAVLGAGPIGLFTLQCALAAGASRAVTVELVPARARVARGLGADAIIDPRSVPDSAAAIAEALGGPPDVVFDAAGVPATLQAAVDTVKPGGQVMMVGVAFNNAPIKPSTWVTRRVTVRASFAYSRADYRSTIDLLVQGRIKVDPLITSVVPASETQAAFERLLHPNTEIKVLVDPHA